MSATISVLHPPGALTPDLDAEIRRIFDLQRKTALRLRTSTAAERIAKLRRLRVAVLAHSEAIIEAGARDSRRPSLEVEFTELMPVILDISHTCRNLKKWLKPRKVRPTAMMLGTQAWTRFEPRGRCLIIAPWNYPITLTFGPLVPAIASGNTVIIKTSEVAPSLSRVMVKIIRETFTEDEIAIVEGDVSVATSLLALPFDHIFFTGAPSIGKVVMAAASKHLSSVTLELGGKSPTIIDETADTELAVKTIAWAKFINSGQTCIAPDHIYVHASVKNRVVELFRHYLTTWYGSTAEAMQKSLTHVINERHTQRVADLIEDAKSRGAEVLYGGVVNVPEHFVSPTLLGNISPDAKIMTEEIFGPVLPIIVFNSVDEVITRINAAPKPLALYIWTRNEEVADYVIEHTSAGGTCVNHAGVHFLHHNLPFGGINNSGIGSYNGEWGIRAFSHERAILKTRIMLSKMFFPPYTQRIRKIVRWIIEHS